MALLDSYTILVPLEPDTTKESIFTLDTACTAKKKEGYHGVGCGYTSRGTHLENVRLVGESKVQATSIHFQNSAAHTHKHKKRDIKRQF